MSLVALWCITSDTYVILNSHIKQSNNSSHRKQRGARLGGSVEIFDFIKLFVFWSACERCGNDWYGVCLGTVVFLFWVYISRTFSEFLTSLCKSRLWFCWVVRFPKPFTCIVHCLKAQFHFRIRQFHYTYYSLEPHRCCSIERLVYIYYVPCPDVVGIE